MKRALSTLFTLVLALQVFAGSASAATIYVDDDGPGNYTTIQAALLDAVDGDTIIVYPGTYPDEHIQVEKSVTIKGASEYPSVGGFDILRQSKIEGLTITQDVNFEGDGVSCTIRNNKFNGCGVSIGNNYMYGNQVIMNNLFTESPTGVSVFDSRDNEITGNTFQNCVVGISFISGIGGHVVTGNTFKDCSVGIRISQDSASIYNNYFSNNVNLMVEEDSNLILNTKMTSGKNIIGGPYLGGNFWGSPSGDGFSQTHNDTNGDGIAEEAYQIYDDVIDYLPLVTPKKKPEPVFPAVNFKASTTRGNAPLSVQFTDLSQNADSLSWDFDNNGQPDSDVQNPAYVYENPGAYTVNLTGSNANGTAWKTVVITVLEKQIAILPEANFSANPTSGYLPLSVTFTDLSKNATSRSWDVNNDGIVDSTDPSFVYVYNASGTYSAKLTAINENGTDSKTDAINVMEEESSGGDSSGESSGGSSSGGSSGGRSSGGGAVGGSPEPARNVEVKELSQVFITNGKAVKFDFKKNATCVVYVGFDAIKNAGKITTIVEQLNKKSSLVSELPEGEVYKSFNVWVGNSGYATSKNIANPVLCFKVEKAWLDDKSINQDSITLNRYENKEWKQLAGNLSGEDDKFLYITTDVPGFSSFAITAKAKGISGNISEDENGLKTRFHQGEGNETTGLNTGLDKDQNEKTKYREISPNYGVLGMLLLCLICALFYIKLPK
ncbi:MAG: PGF-pre-PGF domain-containing protein [Euryarchaeota archaeon]|nr:PGF-pre-PGF domain-containing protein [Euryarchaeota archaeon]